MTVVTNEDTELIPTSLVTGWRVCIDYRKLNDATRKDHFLLAFMDQMLERLAENEYYCFLDGFSGYFQIFLLTRKTKRRPPSLALMGRLPTDVCLSFYVMSFDVCLPTYGNFPRHDRGNNGGLHGRFLSLWDSFSSCLSHLEKMLKRCEGTNLVLNWEKCHF
ncbi:hypothetical protein Tco_0350048, partial [Tanacetum coccineum]